MFQVLKNAWKMADLRKKMLYTMLLLFVFRLGSYIPVPYLSSDAMQAFLNVGGENQLISFLNVFSGGAFANATIFAMGIGPYITASIIVQLLTVAIPALERLQKESGEEGRQKIAQSIRYVAVFIAFVQGTGFYLNLKSFLVKSGWLEFFVINLSLTAGTAFLVWLGEKINEKGIGNGISLIIFAGIVSSLPSTVSTLVAYVLGGTLNVLASIAIVILSLVIVYFVVLMNDSERRIPVQYAKRVVGRKMYGGQSTHIPIKLLAAGVMPIIFAMSFLSFPSVVAGFFGVTGDNNWFIKLITPGSWFYGILYFILIIFFTYFYIAIQYNPIEMANNMKKTGAFIPGLRPGRPTSEYISKVITKVTLAGAVFLGFIAVVPMFLNYGVNLNIGIGGTSLLILVGVALETTKQLESNMLMRHYKGFL